jgi:undecaprenyl phosphate N,N'-diacetylbacillosamine 1-phosphate transferase
MVYKIYIKRIFDFLFAFIVLLLTLPILLLTIIILGYQNKGKVFFRQERPGKDKKAFFIIKFKTMTDAKDSNGKLLPDKDRITYAGKIIRKLSIDELPQMINVIKGEMSLIGPRPLLFKYIPLYNPEQSKRHEVRPGITGWAQVNGRNSISWSEKFKLDVYYVENVSIYLDIRIFFMTIAKIFLREGINQTQERPMEPFNGNN